VFRKQKLRYTTWSGGKVDHPTSWRSRDRFPPRNPQFFNRRFLNSNFANMKFRQQKIQCIAPESRVPSRHWESNPKPLYQQTVLGTTMVPVCCVVINFAWSFVIYREDSLSIKFGENDSFQKLFLFSKIPFSVSVESPRIFQGLISIPAGHWVRQIDGKSSAIYRADSFCQHYSALRSAWQEDPNNPQERCAMARGYRKLILRVNLLNVPHIKI